MNGIYSIPQECYTRKEAEKILSKKSNCQNIKIQLGIFLLTNATIDAAWFCQNQENIYLLSIFKNKQFSYGVIKYLIIEEDEIFFAQDTPFVFHQSELCLIEIVNSSSLMHDIAFVRFGIDVNKIDICKVQATHNNKTVDIVCWYWTNTNNNIYIYPVFIKDKDLITADSILAIFSLVFKEKVLFFRDGFFWEIQFTIDNIIITPHSTENYES